MELIDKEKRCYGPPAKLKMRTPEYDVRASWGPSLWAQTHTCTVRGVPVCKLGPPIPNGIHGNLVQCVFPDFRAMLVNEANIHARKIEGEIRVKGALKRTG